MCGSPFLRKYVSRLLLAEKLRPVLTSGPLVSRLGSPTSLPAWISTCCAHRLESRWLGGGSLSEYTSRPSAVHATVSPSWRFERTKSTWFVVGLQIPKA